MGYDHIRDTNGVTWKVISLANGFHLIASVMDDADPKYDPPAQDQEASMAQGGIQVGGVDIVHTDPPTGEQARVLYTELVANVEKYAQAHRGEVDLKVTAHADATPWWLWVGLGLVLLRRPR